jgi:ketosteroid isomerase-like protein
MSQENVEIARRAHKAFSHPGPDGFDLDTLYRYTDLDLVVDWSRSNGLEAGIYRGEAETRRLWDTLSEVFDRVVVEPLEFIEHGEHVVVPHHLRASRRDGLAVDARALVVFTLRNQRIVEMRLYQARGEALGALGLAE